MPAAALHSERRPAVQPAGTQVVVPSTLVSAILLAYYNHMYLQMYNGQSRVNDFISKRAGCELASLEIKMVVTGVTVHILLRGEGGCLSYLQNNCFLVL